MCGSAFEQATEEGSPDPAIHILGECDIDLH